MMSWIEPRILDRVACKLVTIPTEISWLLCAVFGSKANSPYSDLRCSLVKILTVLAHLNV